MQKILNLRYRLEVKSLRKRRKIQKQIGRPKKTPIKQKEIDFIKQFRKDNQLTQQGVCDIINQHRANPTPLDANNYRQFEYGRRRMPDEIKDILSREFNIERKLFDGWSEEEEKFIDESNQNRERIAEINCEFENHATLMIMDCYGASLLKVDENFNLFFNFKNRIIQLTFSEFKNIANELKKIITRRLDIK